MDLNLKDKLFLVGGATGGFGKAIAEALVNEDARVIAVARGLDALKEIEKKARGRIQILAGDLTQPETTDRLFKSFDLSGLSGAVINAGGPPAKSFMETNLDEWDDAYRQVLRWKVGISQLLIPFFIRKNYGRMLFIESISVKQPIEDLVLSNSLRMAVTGFVKSLSMDMAGTGITLNVLAPGYHHTSAIDRLVKKMTEAKGISMEEALGKLQKKIPAGYLGRPADFASLACWLLSEHSSYITGQTISVDGGVVKGVFG